MLVPRRVRRRLLLPPGWVALGFVLLLGCQALRPWERQVRLWNVLQVTMLKRKLEPSDLKAFGKEYRLPYKSAIELNRARPWHTIEFSGNALADSLSAVTTETAIRTILTDIDCAGGVRVRFLPGATYANLVKVLNIMSYTGQKRYWLDIRHKPTTLYAITNKSRAAGSDGCLLCGDVLISPPAPVVHTFQQLLAEFWQRVEILGEHVWRQPLLLLLVISSLGLWRLLPTKLSCFNS